jgi:acyl-CoA synthetase (AMP-forming)/AMP-acid ligase II/thioesterase domain-containing protein/acyl carrier protein
MSLKRIMSYIEAHALSTPETPAILAPRREPLNYAQLNKIVRETGGYLASLGLGINDRVAVALTDGMDMACAFFAVSNIATFIPLNPAFSSDEFKYYLRLLKVKALLVQENTRNEAEQAAAELGITLITLASRGVENGLFLLSCEKQRDSFNQSPYQTGHNQDIATINYTSGTTGKPKVIPRTHTNLCTTAENTARVYNLTGADRCLIITPMFRGVSIATLLSSVISGDSAVCAGSFKPVEFFRMLQELSPTWYLAGPAVLQSIVEYAENNQIAARGSSLRFIRSSGAPLSAKLAERLEQVFGVPAIVSYGMSEAGNIACGYLAPKGHKAGSVGVSMGYEIGIVDEKGELLPAGASGEIAVCGPNVMSGYENDPEANKRAFVKGWFKTGDQGHLDQDGYLFITGRIKELINRGGEKISPYEVEIAILEHPDVLEAVVFPVPDGRFGEDVAVLVVLKAGSDLSIRQLRSFLKGKTVHFKMPTSLYVADQIPKGPAGKIQRNNIYQQLANFGAVNISTIRAVGEITAPRSETEEKLAAIWKEILHVDAIDILDNFFDLGGDSLLVSMLFAYIEEVWGRKIPLSLLFEGGTIEQLAQWIDKSEEEKSSRPFLVPIQVGGDKPPLFCIHAKDGEVLSYWYLAVHMGSNQPVYGLRFNLQGLSDNHPFSITDLASRYIRDIRSIQPEGPYYLAGHSGGGIIALEIARLFRAEGQEVALLVMFDSKFKRKRDNFADVMNRNFKETRETHDISEFFVLFCQKVIGKLNKYKQIIQAFTYTYSPTRYKSFIARHVDTEVVIQCSSKKYELRPYEGEIIFFLPEEHYRSSSSSLQEWYNLVENVKVVETTGNHHNMILEPHVGHLANKLKKYLEMAAVNSD